MFSERINGSLTKDLSRDKVDIRLGEFTARLAKRDVK